MGEKKQKRKKGERKKEWGYKTGENENDIGIEFKKKEKNGNRD